MLDYDDFHEDDDNTPGDGHDESGPMKALRDENRKLKDQVKAMPGLQRKLAAFELGLDPKQAQVRLFLKASDIDFSDIEKVRSAAEEYELIKPEGQQEANAEQQAEQEAHGRVAGAEADAAAPDSGGTVVDYSQAKTEAEVIAMVKAQGGEVYQ